MIEESVEYTGGLLKFLGLDDEHAERLLNLHVQMSAAQIATLIRKS